MDDKAGRRGLLCAIKGPRFALAEGLELL